MHLESGNESRRRPWKANETTVGASTDDWSSVRRPAGIPADWLPRCPLPFTDPGRCRSILRPVRDELDRLKCKHHSDLWFPDDPRIIWKPIRNFLPGAKKWVPVYDHPLFMRLPKELVTALNRAAHERNCSRIAMIREALAAYPLVGYHLEKILATRDAKEQSEEQAELGRKARVVASEVIAEYDQAFDAITVEELNLTPRSLACLKKAGLDTVGAVNSLGVKQLLDLPDMKARMFGEIHTAISARSHRRRADQDIIVARSEALTTLPEKHSPLTKVPVEDVLVLRDLRAMTWDQIGSRLGTSAQMARTRYWKVKNTTLLGTALADLELRDRTYDLLRRQGIDTIGQLLDRATELPDLPGFDDEMRNEVQVQLYRWTELLGELDQVPPKLQALLRSEGESVLIGMRDDDKLPWNEIADRFEIRAGTARVRYHRAKKRETNQGT